MNGVAHSMADAAGLQMSVEDVEEILHYTQKTPIMLSDKNVDADGQKRILGQNPSPSDFTFLSDNTPKNVITHKRFCHRALTKLS